MPCQFNTTSSLKSVYQNPVLCCTYSRRSQIIFMQCANYFSNSLQCILYISCVKVFGPPIANRRRMTQPGSLSAHRPFHRENLSAARPILTYDTWQIRLQGAPLFLCQHACLLPGPHPWKPHPCSPPSSICVHHCGLRPAVSAKPSLLSFLLTAVMCWRLRPIMSPHPTAIKPHNALNAHSTADTGRQ